MPERTTISICVHILAGHDQPATLFYDHGQLEEVLCKECDMRERVEDQHTACFPIWDEYARKCGLPCTVNEKARHGVYCAVTGIRIADLEEEPAVDIRKFN